MNIKISVLALITISTFVGASILPQLTYDESIDPYIFEQEINETINGIIGNIPDPLFIENIEIPFPDGLLSGSLNISDLNITGIHNVVLSNLTVNIVGIKIQLVLMIPNLKLLTNYEMFLGIQNQDLLGGNGDVVIEIDDTAISCDMTLNLANFQVQDVRIQLTLGTDSIFNVTGVNFLNNQVELVSFLTPSVVKAINLNHEEISDVISPIVESLINSILANIGGTTPNDNSTPNGDDSTPTTTPAQDPDNNSGYAPSLTPLTLFSLIAVVIFDWY